MRRSTAAALHYLVGLCLIFGIPLTASAQVLGGPRPQTTTRRDYGFLTTFHTAIDLKHLNSADADTHFRWDVDVSFDMDVLDAGLLRANLFINVETIVGNEFRAVDPNQNNYTSDVSVFVRLPHGELSTTLHHVSRHLSDRGTDDAVAWNMVGIGYGNRVTLGRFELDAGARALWTVKRAGVDYEAQYEGYARILRAINDRFALFGRADGVTVQIDPLELGRSSDRHGGHVEGGLRIVTGVASVDLFVGREQRIDATSQLRERTRWTRFGVRVATPIP